MLKIAFFGTPEFSLHSLESLFDDERIEITAVITQPDKPSGRGMKLTPSPIKTFAESLDIKVFQPASLKKESETEELWTFLRQTGPYDAFVCVAYGKVIPEDLLYFPALGTINIHPSILPRWRGAAPMQRALFEGDTKTGVSIMQLEQGLDSGPVYLIEEVVIEKDETLGSLHNRLAILGANLLVEALPKINDGGLKAKIQSEQGITYAEKWGKEELTIDWQDTATWSERRIRASSPIPGARTTFREEMVKIHSSHVEENRNFTQAKPGVIVEVNKEEIIVACGDNSFLSIDTMQLAGKAKLPIAEVLKGTNFTTGEAFQ